MAENKLRLSKGVFSWSFLHFLHNSELQNQPSSDKYISNVTCKQAMTEFSILTSSDPTAQSGNGLFGYGHNSMMICKLVPICTAFILTIVGHKCTILFSK